MTPISETKTREQELEEMVGCRVCKWGPLWHFWTKCKWEYAWCSYMFVSYVSIYIYSYIFICLFITALYCVHLYTVHLFIFVSCSFVLLQGSSGYMRSCQVGPVGPVVAFERYLSVQKGINPEAFCEPVALRLNHFLQTSLATRSQRSFQYVNAWTWALLPHPPH